MTGRPTPRDGNDRVDKPRAAPGGRHNIDEVVAWPPLGWEPQVWDPPAGGGMTRRERAAAGREYRSAIVPEIADQELVLPSWLAADLEDATAQVARFDADGAHRFGTLTSVLIRSESASSSQIEQISASARAIAEAEVTGEGSGNAAVIAANVRAMSGALASTDPLDSSRIEQIQHSLLADHSPALIGWRAEPVWIGGGLSTPVDADYVGPAHTRIAAAIDDLTRFIARDDLPVLAQAGIAHAQFETIHPFADGNGRTGRALVHLLLRDKGLVRSMTVPISSGLLADKDGYFRALTAYRSGDAAPIISLFIHATIHSVHHAESFASTVESITDHWRSRVTARSDSAVWKALDAVPAHPVADAEMLATAAGTDPRNIHRSLRQLTDAGILIGHKHYKSRRYLFRAPEILQALDDYASGLGRRA